MRYYRFPEAREIQKNTFSGIYIPPTYLRSYRYAVVPPHELRYYRSTSEQTKSKKQCYWNFHTAQKSVHARCGTTAHTTPVLPHFHKLFEMQCMTPLSWVMSIFYHLCISFSCHHSNSGTKPWKHLSTHISPTTQLQIIEYNWYEYI